MLPGDALVMYTDGVTESSNDAGDDFGDERLAEAVRSRRDLGAEAIVEGIVDEVRAFGAGEQHDDITVLVAKCRE